MTGNEAIARHLAGRGPDAIEKMAALVARAREILAEPNVLATPDPLAGPTYGWQAEERFDPDAHKQMYVGSVEDNPVGFGMSVWVFLALARTDSEFRRMISSHVGPELADAAVISSDPAAPVPHSELIRSVALQRVALGGNNGMSEAAAFAAVMHCQVDYG